MIGEAMRRDIRWHITCETSFDEMPGPTDNLIQTEPTLEFTLDYPLTNPFHFKETQAFGGGWTERQFLNAIHRAYAKVYEAEGPYPGTVSAVLLNRAPTEGPYGIWGHDIDDLYLEGATRNSDGSWTLVIGS